MTPELIMMWAGRVLLGLGVGFVLLGSIGILRFPDFYTRAHAASKPDTLGLILAMIGLALMEGFTISSAKLLLIFLIIALGNPAAAHALGRAALRGGLAPWMKGEVKR